MQEACHASPRSRKQVYIPGGLPKPIDRTFRGQLQLVVGDLGAVQPYRFHTDVEHRSIGWYVAPSAAAARCKCPYCAAARAGAELYLGYHVRDAIVEAELAARQHPKRVVAA